LNHDSSSRREDVPGAPSAGRVFVAAAARVGEHDATSTGTTPGRAARPTRNQSGNLGVDISIVVGIE
jgi:hypothetical protein